jgi:CRP/FNR family transcriptional regulator
MRNHVVPVVFLPAALNGFEVVSQMNCLDQARPLGAHLGCSHHVMGEDCRLCHVRPLSVCAALEPDEWASIEKLSTDVRFEERETLVREADDVVSLYTITAGVVRLVKTLQDGRRQLTGFAMPGDFLGLSLERNWTFSVEAITPVTACRFSRTAMMDYVDQKPHFLMRLHEMATHELTLAQDHMVLLGRLTAEEKIGAFLLEIRRRWARIEGHASDHIPLPMGRQDIADYLGLTIETVSRTINQMQRTHQLVIVPDGVRLLNVAYFEQLCP